MKITIEQAEQYIEALEEELRLEKYKSLMRHEMIISLEAELKEKSNVGREVRGDG